MCLCVAKASHSHKTWAEVSFSAPHFLHKGLSLSPIMWRCLLKVLCPVSRPVTTLDCVLLKDSSLVLAAVRGPEINSWACLWVPASPCHIVKCCLSNQHWIFFLIVCLETPRAGSCPIKWLSELPRCELFGNSISTYSSMSGDPKESHRIMGGYIIQHPLALPYQWGRCFSSL
jgi:hypothetical protein